MSEAPPLLSGIFAAALTPFREDLVPDDAALIRHCRWLLENGADGLGVLGTTGEANSLSLKERIRLIESLFEAGIPGSVLLPGTGCCAITDTVTLTKRAVDLGAAGVLMLPPFYYKNVTDQGLFDAYSRIIENVGDARLRVYLYHFPQMSATPISLSLIERLLKAYPGTIAGMKDSSGDFDNMSAAARNFPGFAVFSGADNFLLPILKAGGVGSITACANVAAPLAAEVYRLWKAGDMEAAEKAHERLCLVREKLTVGPYPSVLKAVMARHTGDEGWSRVRPPLVAQTEAERAAVFEGLDSTGYSLPPISWPGKAA